jgi:aspartyl-tRNA(Asn)/glutamyl-tRNA(Gln) amidotransferase subunit C
MKMRDDTITDGGYPERVLKNAPQREDDFFVVPKVVE